MAKKFIFRGITFICAMCMCFSLVACGQSEGGSGNGENGGNQGENPGGEIPDEKVSLDGWYLLVKKTVQGTDITGDYLWNAVRLSEGAVTMYETDLTGQTVTDGTYTVSENTVTMKFGISQRKFVYSAAEKQLDFSGSINRRKVTMQYRFNGDFSVPEASGGVPFTGELFGDDITKNFYNYCPTVMTEGNDTMHVWYCSNKDSGNVTDYVAYRKGKLNASGKWEFSEKSLVLSPGSGDDWDSRHVCDPSVVKGKFTMGGETYSYLMAYLGCKTSNNSCNEVGIAVAKAPEGPWIKVERLNPVANFYQSSDYAPGVWRWGYGQPSLVNSDGEGKVLLFYTKGAAVTGTNVEEWDFSDLDTVEKPLRKSVLREGGISNAAGSNICIHNADFAYDPVLRRLYCYEDDFPNPTDGGVDVIADTGALFFLELGEKGNGFDILFGTDVYNWNLVNRITPSLTGFARNHNVGIVTDGFGALTNPYRVPLVYTMSYLKTDFPDWEYQNSQWPFLHTYRLHGLVFDVS